MLSDHGSQFGPWEGAHNNRVYFGRLVLELVETLGLEYGAMMLAVNDICSITTFPVFYSVVILRGAELNYHPQKIMRHFLPG